MTPEDRAYALDAFAHWARSGYAPDLLDEAEERLADLLPDAPPAAFVREARDHARRILDGLRAAEATWTEPTVNDRITEAFADLEDRGIVALEDAGYTVSDGWEDAREAAEELDEARGAVFFHGQDVERGVRGEGLTLAFGAFSKGAGSDEASIGIGREVVEVLAAHGIATTWKGTAQHRIEIPPFPWQKRQFTESPL
jgi:hypothetical protein